MNDPASSEGVTTSHDTSLPPDDRPTDIGSGRWKRILGRVYKRLDGENASILAAGVAFYGVFALFPALGAIVSTYALFADPADVQAHFQLLAGVLPREVVTTFDDQLATIASTSDTGLGLGAIGSFLLTVWSARRGSDALVRAITLAYREHEDRKFVPRTLLVYGITLAMVIFVVIAMLGLVALPLALQFLPLPLADSLIARLAGWLGFVVLVSFLVGWLFRTAPPRRAARLRWLTAGSLLTTVLWLAGSAGLSWYSSSFADFNETYGALGAIAVLLLWFQLAAFSLTLGATLNAEIEFEARGDTTVGPDRPRGRRNAYVADHRPAANDSGQRDGS